MPSFFFRSKSQKKTLKTFHNAGNPKNNSRPQYWRTNLNNNPSVQKNDLCSGRSELIKNEFSACHDSWPPPPPPTTKPSRKKPLQGLRPPRHDDELSFQTICNRLYVRLNVIITLHLSQNSLTMYSRKEKKTKIYLEEPMIKNSLRHHSDAATTWTRIISYFQSPIAQLHFSPRTGKIAPFNYDELVPTKKPRQKKPMLSLC